MSGKVIALRIEAPYFVAAVELIDGEVRVAAPIVKYMMRWTHEKVEEYAAARGWKVEPLPDWEEV